MHPLLAAFEFHTDLGILSAINERVQRPLGLFISIQLCAHWAPVGLVREVLGQDRRQKEDLIRTLTSHIDDTILLPAPSSSDPSSSTEDSQLPSSIRSFIIGSQRGLDFLQFVNMKILEDRWSYHHKNVDGWTEALKSLQFFRGLPPDYFEPIPDVYLGFSLYTLGSEVCEMDVEVDAGGGQEADSVASRVAQQAGEVTGNKHIPPSLTSSHKKPGDGLRD
ncbi:hypothetical protein E1B28_002061 [Marasmius oreades]|uniref:Uncharacterized protein n=1 Tax=Marasmius oreades TaxID=181124 RepID=A0A9P8AGB0_9AGAR|nr:uncharacterized protein E1B28_002061 [Marasmius oreades]KAG7100288.1 hypothetical protein E1B28_002061 [Marasmius oreades]